VMLSQSVCGPPWSHATLGPSWATASRLPPNDASVITYDWLAPCAPGEPPTSAITTQAIISLAIDRIYARSRTPSSGAFQERMRRLELPTFCMTVRRPIGVLARSGLAPSHSFRRSRF
jgi:hypothetical protein